MWKRCLAAVQTDKTSPHHPFTASLLLSRLVPGDVIGCQQSEQMSFGEPPSSRPWLNVEHASLSSVPIYKPDNHAVIDCASCRPQGRSGRLARLLALLLWLNDGSWISGLCSLPEKEFWNCRFPVSHIRKLSWKRGKMKRFIFWCPNRSDSRKMPKLIWDFITAHFIFSCPQGQSVT